MDNQGLDEVVRNQGLSAVVMVLSTPEAEAICQKSGLSVTDLFRPCSTVEDANLTVQTVGEPYRMKNFEMRFVHSSEFIEVPKEIADQHFQRLVAEHEMEEEVQATPPWITGIAAPNGVPVSKPWFNSFRKLLVTSLRNGEQCSLDHPVACILVAASTEAGQVQAMNSLLSAAQMPAVLRDGLADHAMARSYVVLHDCAASPAPREDTALLQLRQAYGAAACAFLPINSRAHDAPQLEDRWTPGRPAMAPAPAEPAGPGSSSQPLAGALLSSEDTDRVAAYVKATLTRIVIAARFDPPAFRLHAGRLSPLRPIGSQKAGRSNPLATGGGAPAEPSALAARNRQGVSSGAAE